MGRWTSTTITSPFPPNGRTGNRVRTHIVPTDGSESADAATEHALELARRFDAPLHVLNVVDTTALQATDAYSGSILDALQEEGEERIDWVSKRAEGDDIDVTTAVVKGTPASSIVEEAEDDDVIVMGTHGCTGLDRYLIGSTIEKVVRTADVPVVTVPMTENGESDER